MSFEILVKRTIWIVNCQTPTHTNAFRLEWLDNPPREVQCPYCKTWLTPTEATYIGTELNKERG